MSTNGHEYFFNGGSWWFMGFFATKKHECPSMPMNGHEYFLNGDSWWFMGFFVIKKHECPSISMNGHEIFLLAIHGGSWAFLL